MKQIKFQRQSGLTLLEILLTLGILSSVFAGAAGLFDSYSTNMRSTVVGQQTNTFGQAMQAYIKDNYVGVSNVATETKPTLILVKKLKDEGYLTSAFTEKNVYGQYICGLVLQPDPATDKLNAIVVTEGGTAINDLDLGQVAGTIGGAGGGIYTSAPTTLRGTMGGWSMAVGNYTNDNHLGLTCNGSPGKVTLAAGHPVMALWFTGGDTSSGLLYRNTVPGHPELNQMDTDIDMNNHSINNADALNAKTLKTLGIATIGGNTSITGTLDVTGTATAGNLTTAGIATAGKVKINDTVFEGYTCAGNVNGGTATAADIALNGLVAKDATGLLLSCQSGVWKRQVSLANVSNYQNIPFRQGNITINIGNHALCTFSGYEGPGSLDTKCKVYKNNENWFLWAYKSDWSNVEYQVCHATCFD